MIGITLLIIWSLFALVMDGYIYPDLIWNHFDGKVPLWNYLIYFAVMGLLFLFTYYQMIEEDET